MGIKKDKRGKSKQQKQKSATVKAVKQPKPISPEPEAPPPHLCEDCVYEFGECEGNPVFQDEKSDRVVKCDAYLAIGEGVHDADVATILEPSESAPEPEEEDHLESELEPEKPPEIVKAEPIQRAPLNRFNDDTDYGNCQACTRSLKRTAYSRYVDAIRCTNPRCRAYRAIVKTVSSGAK